ARSRSHRRLRDGRLRARDAAAYASVVVAAGAHPSLGQHHGVDRRGGDLVWPAGARAREGRRCVRFALPGLCHLLLGGAAVGAAHAAAEMSTVFSDEIEALRAALAAQPGSSPLRAMLARAYAAEEHF